MFCLLKHILWLLIIAFVVYYQEEDLKLLQQLQKQEQEDMAIQTARKERARADASWMKQVGHLQPFCFTVFLRPYSQRRIKQSHNLV